MREAVAKVRAGITLAAVEVEVLCRILDVALPVGVPARLDSHAVHDAAIAGLAARGLVGAGADVGLEVHEAVGRTVCLASRCRSAVVDGDEILATGPGASVCLRRGALDVVRLEPLRAVS